VKLKLFVIKINSRLFAASWKYVRRRHTHAWRSIQGPIYVYR